MRILALLALLMFSGQCVAQSPYTNSVFPAQLATASAQTLSTISLSGNSGSAAGSSFAAGTITVTGNALTTVTFSVMGSGDNGVTFYALPIYTQNSPTTAAATSITATTAGLYQVSLVGITHVKLVTSGTFTATVVSFVFTATPQATIAKSSSSGASGINQLNGDGSAGPGSGNQTFTLATTAVTPGSYTNANVTVDAKGRLTAAANGTASSGTVNSASAFAPTYYPGLGTAVSGATPFTGPQCDSTSGAPAACTPSQLQTAVGAGIYVPVGGYYAGTATGAVNVLAVTLNTNIGTPTQAQLIGVPISFTPNLTNTNTTPTLNVSGLGAVTITKCSTTPVAANDLATGAVAQVIYNGTSYQLQNPQMAICQTATAGALAVGGTLSASLFSPTASSTNVTYGGTSGNSSSQTGSATYQGTPNSGTGQAGNTFIKAGANTDGVLGVQGFAQIQQSFTTASALAATFEAVSMTTTVDQVGASAAGSLTNVGIAQTVGGTNTQLFVVSHGKTTARFDGTPVIGDVACYPLSGGTAGLLHDNASTACTLGEAAGIVTGQVSGSGSGATATVLIR